MKKLILLTFLLSILLPREVFLNTNEALSVKSSQYSQGTNIERGDDLIDNSVITREDIILFEWNFESTDSLWNDDDGWVWTDSDYHSETHSYLSPNDESTYNSSWDLISDTVTLPELGDGEIMRFKFWLNGDTPDTDGDGDNYLEDYYQLSIMDLEALAWHASENAPETYWFSYDFSFTVSFLHFSTFSFSHIFTSSVLHPFHSFTF